MEMTNCCDDNTVLVKADEILENDHILEQIKYKNILIDEFQGTGHYQNRIFDKLLTISETFTIVVDVDQSIYGGRGDYPTYFEVFSEKDVEYVTINENLIKEKMDFDKKSKTNKNLNTYVESESVGKLLNTLDKFFNKPIFLRQLRRYDLDDDELKIVKDEIRLDIINHVISESDDIKKVIKNRCSEFRKHDDIEDSEINNLLDNINVDGIDDDIVKECKNNVKQDFFEGNVTINNVELKFNNYQKKKINESNQLKELDKIKNNPNVPSIKIHLTQEENDEIDRITEMEILSVHGINGSVENRVHYWVNQKIRDNQSIARGRLNSLKRDFSNLTQLSKIQQSEFVYQIEFYINENKLKPYDITEENIIIFSKDFKENGKLKL